MKKIKSSFSAEANLCFCFKQQINDMLVAVELNFSFKRLIFFKSYLFNAW